MSVIDTDFSAKEPSLGYIYQIKYALLLLLTNARDLDNPKVKIENLDDVEIEEIDTINLYQTKLHIKNKGNLTDSSIDFWKTIRVWSENITNGFIDPDKTIFNLITTEKVPSTSVLYNFIETNNSDKEITQIVNQLDDIILKSTNLKNKSAYDAFQKLSLAEKKKLIQNIRIIDNSIEITEIDNRLKKQLILSSYPSHLDAFLEILDGWWLKKSIQILTSKIDFIDAEELQIKIANIRDSFNSDNLPNHFPEPLEISDEDVDNIKEKQFIKQLEMIQINTNSRAVKRAISDFRRAFEQRSKWSRLQLLNIEEQEEYDKKLEDYWRNIFDIMCDEAEGKKLEELKILGYTFYMEQFAKRCPQIKIRDKFNEDFLTRGSYQMLSDMKKIGWHPNYKNEL